MKRVSPWVGLRAAGLPDDTGENRGKLEPTFLAAELPRNFFMLSGSNHPQASLSTVV